MKSTNNEKKNIQINISCPWNWEHIVDMKNDMKANIFTEPRDQTFKFKINEIIFSKRDDMLFKRLTIGSIVSSLVIGTFLIEAGGSLSEVIFSSLLFGPVCGFIIMISPITAPLCGAVMIIIIPLKMWYYLRKE